MALKNVCRLCLVNDTPMHVLHHSPLLEVYEKLTSISLNASHCPLVACYLCYSQLKKCYNLMVESVRANEVLSQLLRGDEAEGELVAVLNSKALKSHLSVTPVELITISGANHLIKPEIREEPLSSHFLEEWDEEDMDRVIQEKGMGNAENVALSDNVIHIDLGKAEDVEGSRDVLIVGMNKKRNGLEGVIDIDTEGLTDNKSVDTTVGNHNFVVANIKKEPLLTKCVKEMKFGRPTFAERLRFEDEEDVYRAVVPRSMNDFECEVMMDQEDIKQEVLEGSVIVETDESRKVCTLYEPFQGAVDIGSERLTSGGNIETVVVEDMNHLGRMSSEGDIKTTVLEEVKYVGRNELTGEENTIYEHLETEEDNTSKISEGNKRSVNIEIDGLTNGKHEVCKLYDELEDVVNIDIETVTSDGEIVTVVLDDVKYVRRKKFTNGEDAIYEELKTAEDIENNRSEGNEGSLDIDRDGLTIEKHAVCMLYEELKEAVDIGTESVLSDGDIETVLGNLKHFGNKEFNVGDDMIYDDLEAAEGIRSSKFEGAAAPVKKSMEMFAEHIESKTTVTQNCKNITEKPKPYKVFTEIPRRYFNIRTYKLRGTKNDTHNIQVSLNTSSYSDSINACPNTNVKISNVDNIRSKDLKQLFMCNSCGKIFDDKYLLAEHIKHHDYVKNKNLNATLHHNEVHVQKQSKTRINRTLNKEKLPRSLRIRTLEKLYQCNICHLKCGDKNDLKMHYTTHAGNQSFECDVCYLKFDQEIYLKHRRTHGKKPFQCGVCSIRFARRYSLNRHLRLYANGHFACMCNAVFNTKCGIHKHSKRHSNDE